MDCYPSSVTVLTIIFVGAPLANGLDVIIFVTPSVSHRINDES